MLVTLLSYSSKSSCFFVIKRDIEFLCLEPISVGDQARPKGPLEGHELCVHGLLK